MLQTRKWACLEFLLELFAMKLMAARRTYSCFEPEVPVKSHIKVAGALSPDVLIFGNTGLNARRFTAYVLEPTAGPAVLFLPCHNEASLVNTHMIQSVSYRYLLGVYQE